MSTSPIDAITNIVSSCTRCWMHSAHNGPIAYTGPDSPSILVLGGTPNEAGDKINHPLSGHDGAVFTEMVRDSKAKASAIGYVNVVACYPGKKKNGRARDVTVDERAACHPNLMMQVLALKPTVTLVIGAMALSSLRVDLQVSKDRGRPFIYPPFGVAIPTYHPSAALKAKHLRWDIVKDLRQAWWRARITDPMMRWPDTCRVCGGTDDIMYDEHGVCWCEGHYDQKGRPGENVLDVVPMTLI